jgi:transposase InsO family protein
MWGTNLTTVITGAGSAAVFVAVDHCSAECVGIHASPRATRLNALEPVRQAVRNSFGAIGRDVAAGLKIRHDHGSQYMSGDFQREIWFLGATSSPAFSASTCRRSASSSRSGCAASGTKHRLERLSLGRRAVLLDCRGCRLDCEALTPPIALAHCSAARPSGCRRVLVRLGGEDDGQRPETK